jgi:hypothetical protein
VPAGSSVFAAPFQNKLQERYRELYWKAYSFVIETANSAGYLPGTEPPKGPDEIVEAGMATIQDLMTRPKTWTIREQRAVQEWFAALWERSHGNGASETN